MGAHPAWAAPRPASEPSGLDWEGGAPSSAVWEVITAPERIRAILTTAAALGSPALLRQRDTVTSLRLDPLDPGTMRLHWTGAAPEEGPCDVELRGHGCVYRLHLSGDVDGAGRWVTPLPWRMIQRNMLHQFYN